MNTQKDAGPNGLVRFLGRYPGLAIFLLAFLVRAGFVFYAIHLGADFYVTDDSKRYDRLALNQVHRFQFRAAPFSLEELHLPGDYEQRVLHPGYFTDPAFFDGPDTKRVPGFTLLLGMFYAIFGYAPFLFLYAQAFLGALTCWLVYRLGVTINQANAGVLGGLILALHPRSLIHVGQIQVEVVFIFFLVLLVLVAIRYAASPSLKNLLWFGALLGWTTITREMGYYLFILMAPAILYPLFSGPRSARSRLLAKTAFLFMIPFLVIQGWQARNLDQTGYPVWTGHTEFTKAWHFGPIILGAAWHVPIEDARLAILARVVGQHPEYKDLAKDYVANADPDRYYMFQHLLEFNIRSAALVTPLLIEHLPTTLSAFAMGALWSPWSGIGEWRPILGIRNADYARLREDVDVAKAALATLDVRPMMKAMGNLMTAFPWHVYLVFGCLWLLTLMVYVTSLIGIPALWRSNAILVVTMLGLVAFSFAVSGPAANNRLVVVSLPFLALMSARGLMTINRFPGRSEGRVK